MELIRPMGVGMREKEQSRIFLVSCLVQWRVIFPETQVANSRVKAVLRGGDGGYYSLTWTC